MLRDPWSRFRSAFMRVHQLALSEGRNVSVEAFASEQGDTETQVKSCFNRPNYYVRFLNGEGHCNFKFDYARVAMNRTHLDLAKRVLATFDYVFVAESNRTALEFGDYVGFEQAMPHLSNYAYSTHRTAHGAARAPPPVQHFMAEFYAQNRLDYELYLWGAAWNSTNTRRWREAGPTREIRTPSTRHSLSPHRWALERHGLQAAYAPLVGPAVAFE